MISGILLFSYLVENILKLILLSASIYRSNSTMHEKAIYAVVRSPVRYFDETPTGRIVNRFAGDIGVLDMALGYTASDCIGGVMYFCNLMITVLFMNIWIIIPVSLEVLLFARLSVFMKELVLETKRIDLLCKSPIFQHFQSHIQGIIPISLYGQQGAFRQKMAGIIANNHISNYNYYFVGRIFGVIIQTISSLTSTIGIFLIISQSHKNVSLAGQSLAYFVMVAEYVQWAVRQILNLDSMMSSSARMFRLIDLPAEAPLYLQQEAISNLMSVPNAEGRNQRKGSKNSQQAKYLEPWPSKGEVLFRNVAMRYQKDAELVLKGINLAIRPGEKIGCIGRTGNRSRHARTHAFSQPPRMPSCVRENARTRRRWAPEPAVGFHL